MASAPPPLRVLCIHGYRQNGGSFREKTGALRKLLKKHAELVHVDAPHRVAAAAAARSAPEEEELDRSADDDSRGWWFSDVQARTFDARQRSEKSLGLDASVSAVRDAVKDLGPFDGILGFSQGAALVPMLCSLHQQNQEPEFRFRFAIVVAGFRSACEEHQKFYDAALSIPSLHVFGLEDRVIPAAMSRELLPSFRDPQVLTHPGGHFVPAASAHRQTYHDFLKRFQ